MLHSDPNRLESHIVNLLARHPARTAAWLHERCCALFRPCSLQGIYHELRKLQARGVVVKVGELFSLSLTWAYESVGFADLVYARYLKSPSHLEILPEHNSSKTWHFTNLLRLDDLWVQSMMAIFSHSGATQKFGWNPHPWFYFAQPEKVQLYYQMFRTRGWRYYATLGGETYLDRRYAESMDPSFYVYRLDQYPVFDDMSKYHALIGDYMITVKLDRQTTASIEQLFRSITCEADMNYHRVSRVLNSPGKLSIKVEHNPRRVGRYTRRFKEFFGV